MSTFGPLDFGEDVILKSGFLLTVLWESADIQSKLRKRSSFSDQTHKLFRGVPMRLPQRELLD
jgi:hypothetical protein